MKDSLYIIFNQNGIVETKKRSPSLRSGQYAVEFEFEVPEAFFARPMPKISVALPDSVIPQSLTPDVTIVEPYEKLTGGLMEEARRAGKLLPEPVATSELTAEASWDYAEDAGIKSISKHRRREKA